MSRSVVEKKWANPRKHCTVPKRQTEFLKSTWESLGKQAGHS